MYYNDKHFKHLNDIVTPLLNEEGAVGQKFIVGLDRISMYSNIKKQTLIYVGSDSEEDYYKFLNDKGELLMIYCLDIISITELKD